MVWLYSLYEQENYLINLLLYID